MSKKGIAAIKRKTGYTFAKVEQVLWKGQKRLYGPNTTEDIWLLSGPIVNRYDKEAMDRTQLFVSATIIENNGSGEWNLGVSMPVWDDLNKYWHKVGITVMRGKYKL